MVESSEQGMLAQVARADERGEPVIFLGWEPHPMNANFKMSYLTGGDDFFGPNLGGATVMGPILLGLTKAVQIAPLSASVSIRARASIVPGARPTCSEPVRLVAVPTRASNMAQRFVGPRSSHLVGSVDGLTLVEAASAS